MIDRNPRQRMMLTVKYRVGRDWHEAVIVDQSRGGLGLKADLAPLRGETIELMRHGRWAVAKVAWADGGRFGVEFNNAHDWVAHTTGAPVRQFDLGARLAV